MEREAMNVCTDCNVRVDGSLKYCPLCKKKLTDTPEENGLYPDVVEKKYIDRRTFTDDLMVFLTFIFIGGSVVANLATWHGVPWFLAVAAPIFYTWILVRITIFSDLFTGTKTLFQMLGIMGMMLAFDFVSGWNGWSYAYVLPLVLATGTIYIDCYSYIYKSYWRDNLIYAFVFLPLILYAAGLTHALAPMVLATAASGLTVLGIAKFAIKYFTLEMKKRFHV